MTVSNLELLAKELDKLRGLRHTAVALDALIPYVSGLLDSARATDPEGERQRVRITFESQVEEYRAQVESRRDMFKAIVEAGLSALKAMAVLNGAAAVSILAFLGNLLSKPNALGISTVPKMSMSMAYFAFGVGFAALGLAARYLSQATYGMDYSKNRDTANKWGDIFRNVALAVGVTSLALFFLGVWTAFIAMKLPT